MDNLDAASRIAPDMEVFDSAGEKIGTVNHVRRYAVAGGGDRGTTPDTEDFFEVKTGFLGLGSHYYIPFRAIREVTDAGVAIDKPKDALEGLGWDVDPLKPIGKEPIGGDPLIP
jgi:hypothetical protein